MDIPLYILGPMVVVGIALTALAVKMSGLSKTAKISNAKHAEEILRRDFADLPKVTDGLVTDDGSAAFLPAYTSVGLVEAFGDRFITRILRAGDIRSVSEGSGTELQVEFGEFTHPIGRYVFKTAKAANTVADMLKQLQQGAGNA